MCDPSESSQLTSWLFRPETLALCRARANRLARKSLAAAGDPSSSDAALTTKDSDLSTTGISTDDAVAASTSSPAPSGKLAESFARNFKLNIDLFTKEEDGPWQNKKGHPFLTPEEEAFLVSFYVSKLPSLIGPSAMVPRLHRDPKFTATAALLLRRFFLSNSVMKFDPKAIMVAAAFLASKVEDAMTEVRYLEEGTNLMKSPVLSSDIISSEIHLLSGIHFDLLCFHPYKAVLAITEDLRTYLKSERGRSLVYFPNRDTQRPIIGQDLKPMYDAALQLVNDVIVSDIPSLYTPGQIGLAALMVANEQQQQQQQQQQLDNNSSRAEGDPSMAPPITDIPQIDLLGYLSQRFPDADLIAMESMLRELCAMLRELKEGKHGCGNHHVDMVALNAVNKKMKKVRTWGDGGGSSKKDKKKKRKAGGDEEESDLKRVRT